MKEPKYLIIDLFCGAGGTTTGFDMTNGLAKVIACVNHDANAIKSHWENHPDVVHFTEDIRTLNLSELVKLVNNYRLLYPNAKIILWASLECTNFSKAKGGLARNADSRTLAYSLYKVWDENKVNNDGSIGGYIEGDSYIQLLKPDIIQIENVVEFMAWGELDSNGKPISKNNGTEWMKWRNEICKLGYSDEWKNLNAADYGAYTSRNRLFGMFAKNKELITWPEKTHTKQIELTINKNTFLQQTLFTSLEKWKPVKEVLDLHDEGSSIFGRKKNLSDKTLERIYAGLVKYVAGGKNAYMVQMNSGNPNSKVINLERPSRTLTATGGNQFIVQPQFMLKYNSTNGKTGKHIPPSINEPSPVVSTQNRIGIVKTCFLTKYYSTGANISSVNQPASTITTKDRIAKVQPIWIDKSYSGKDNHQSINSPSGTLLTRNKYSIVSTKFIMNSNFNNIGSSLDKPSPVITASRKHHYLVNPQWGINSGSSIDKPCFTIIARMDKTPPYFVTTESGELAIKIFNDDTEVLIRIKRFMANYGIVDIKMRMLKIPELLKIQGFPNDYKLKGTQTEQKKFIGNAVHPLVVKHWIEAISDRVNLLAKQ